MRTAKALTIISSSLIFALAPAAVRADAVLDWNSTAADLPIADPPVMARVMAAMHGEIVDAVNSIEGRYMPYRFGVTAPAGASAEAAAAAAAHGVLVKLVPAQKANLDNALATSLRKIADGPAKNDGVATGNAVAEKMAGWRAGDGFDLVRIQE